MFFCMDRIRWTVFLSLGLTVVPSQLNAMDNDFCVSALADTSKVYDLDEIVVVTQPKESYRLRMQPISSSVFTARELDALKIDDVRGLSAFVPSYVMPEYGSRLTSAIYIRGIGSRINNPAVGMYLDGMPLMSKSAFNLHTYQIDRIDVLRGPQGTLYGQNTEGGLVRIYSKNPMEYQGTDIKFGLGSHWQRTAEVAHFHRPSDNVAFSASMFYDGTDGFLKNSFSGKYADSRNEAGGKVRVLYRPSRRVTLDYVSDYQYVRQNGFPYGLLNQENGEVSAPETNRQGNYRRNVFNTGLDLNVEAGKFDFNSMTTYQFLKDYMLMDNDFLSSDYMWLEERQLHDAVTQEFSFKGTLSGYWHWTTGLFGACQWLKTNAPVYFGEDMTRPMAVGIQEAMYTAIVNSMAAQMIAGGVPETVAMALAQNNVDKAGGVALDIGMSVPGLFHTPQLDFGIFHESDIELGNRLTLTLGLRYDYNKVKISYDTKAVMTMAANVMGSEAVYSLASCLDRRTGNDYSQFLPKLGLTYKLTDGTSNVYATVAKGFRAGGFNIQMFSDVLQTELMASKGNAMRGDYKVTHTDEDYENINETISYKPEESWNFEAGSHLNLFSGRIHADFAVYCMQIRNLQLSVMAGNYGFGRMMVNAGKSSNLGMEMALRGSGFGNRLVWSASYALTHSVFKDYNENVTVDGESRVVDYGGNRVPFVPRHTLGASADYRLHFLRGIINSLTFGANVSALGRVYWDEANTYSQPLYAVLGAHVDGEFGKATLSFWARNITNTRFNTFAMDSSATGTKLYFAQRGMPFMTGIEIMIHL